MYPVVLNNNHQHRHRHHHHHKQQNHHHRNNNDHNHHRYFSYCLKNISFLPAGVVVGAGMVVGTENNENE